jgi:hypothetical protein
VLSVEEIAKAAMARLNVIQSIRVEYEERWKVLRSIPGKTDGPSEGPLDVVFMSKGEKRYLRLFPRKGSPREPDLVVFDGQMTGDFRYKYTERPDPVMRTAYLNDGKHPRCDDQDMYCRNALGLLMADRDRATAATTIVFPHCLANEDAAQLKQMKREYRVLPTQEEVDGVPCYVVESPAYSRFWVDPAVGYAWRRYEHYASPKNPQVSEMRVAGDFTEVAPGLWLPYSYMHQLFTTDDASGKSVPYMQLSLKVHRIAVNQVTEDDFKVTIPVGVTVADLRTGTMREFRQPIDDALASLADTAAQQLPQNSGWTMRRIVTLAAVVAILTVLPWLLWRRMRSAQASRSA